MLTMFRLAPVRLTTFAMMLCFLGLGRFDTAQGQSLTVSTSTLAFTAPQGGSPASTQSVSIGSTGGNINYSISLQPSGSWLSAAASNGNISSSLAGTAPDIITVQINSNSLAGGSYTGTITLTPTAGTPVVINVSLTVSGSGTATTSLVATPTQISFGYELHQTAPPAQTSQITSGGIPLPLSFSTNVAPTSSCPAGWLQATLSSSTTPATLSVGVVTAGLAPGTCTGSVTVTSNTTTNGTTSVLVGVTLFVSSGPVLNISVPVGLQSVTLQQNGKPLQFGPTTGNPLVLTSSDPNQQIPFTLTTTSTDNWLTVTPSSGTTPANINVEIIPESVLAVGTYNGTLTITSTGLLNNTTSLPVTMTLTSSSSVAVSPATVAFTELQLGALPAPQTLTLTGAPASTAGFTTSVIQGSGGAWLVVSPSSGSLVGTPTTSSASVTLSVATNSLLPGNTYSSTAVITFQNSAIPQILVPVSLTVQPPAAALTATPSAANFTYQAGGTVPAAQSISITNPATGNIPFTVASVSDSWFSVTPAAGTTPGTLTVSVNPQSLQPGSYSGSFTLTSPGVANTIVTVGLFVSASTTPQPFIISNAASGVGGQLSPGEIITIKGSGLGPGTPVSFTVGSLTSPTLGGVQVTFGGYSGTLLYVSSTQINVTVPYEVAGSASTPIVVIYNGIPSNPISQLVATASLGLFTNNSTGQGQASVVNQNYTYNTATSPAPQGSYISVYATGGGQTTPASSDGEVSPTTSLLPLSLQANVTATIGGKAAPVVFAGAAPGYVTGVVQFNIQVPVGVTGPALPIVVSISGTTVQSQAGATVSVQ
jgi:uncharacterized protein (TIGR03437 family)